MHKLKISDETWTRLSGWAEPMVDTPDTVIQRLLDEAEAGRAARLGAGNEEGEGAEARHTMVFECGEHGRHVVPDVRATRFIRLVMTLDAVKGVSSWNAAMRQLAGQMIWQWSRGLQPDVEDPVAFGRAVGICVVQGDRSDTGFEPVWDARWSVQGLGAQRAAEATVRIADLLGFRIAIDFEWRDRVEALHPMARGRITVTPPGWGENRPREREGRSASQLYELMRRGAERIAERGIETELDTGTQGGRIKVRRRAGDGGTTTYAPAAVAELGRSGHEGVLRDGSAGFDLQKALELGPAAGAELQALEDGTPHDDGPHARAVAAIREGLATGQAAFQVQEDLRRVA